MVKRVLYSLSVSESMTRIQFYKFLWCLAICVLVVSIGGACKKRREINTVRSAEGIESRGFDQANRICGPGSESAENDPTQALKSSWEAAPAILRGKFNWQTDFVLKSREEIIAQCKKGHQQLASAQHADASKSTAEAAGVPVDAPKTVNDEDSLYESCWVLLDPEAHKVKPKIWLINDAQKIHQHALHEMVRADSEANMNILMPLEIERAKSDVTAQTRLSTELKTFVKARFDLAVAVLTDLKAAQSNAFAGYKERFKTDDPAKIASVPDVQNFILGQIADAYYCNYSTAVKIFSFKDSRTLSPGTQEKVVYEQTNKFFPYFAKHWDEKHPLPTWIDQLKPAAQ